jgi:hypothetical protein
MGTIRMVSRGVHPKNPLFGSVAHRIADDASPIVKIRVEPAHGVGDDAGPHGHSIPHGLVKLDLRIDLKKDQLRIGRHILDDLGTSYAVASAALHSLAGVIPDGDHPLQAACGNGLAQSAEFQIDHSHADPFPGDPPGVPLACAREAHALGEAGGEGSCRPAHVTDPRKRGKFGQILRRNKDFPKVPHGKADHSTELREGFFLQGISLHHHLNEPIPEKIEAFWEKLRLFGLSEDLEGLLEGGDSPFRRDGLLKGHPPKA